MNVHDMQDRKEEGFWYKRNLNFTKFSIKNKRGGKWRHEGKLPTDYKYKWRIQRKQTLQKSYEEVTIKFLFTF